MDDSGILQLPGFGFRAVNSASCNIICHDVVVGVLLKHLNVIERIAALKKILNEPRALVRPVTKNLSLDGATGTRLRFGNECFPRQFRVRCQRIVERHACRNREQAHADQWQEKTRKTYACREHRNDLVGTRHSAESEKQRQQQLYRQQNDEYLRDLRAVIASDEGQSNMVVNETRDIIADVENEPDGNESGDAVKVNLQEIPNDISIK